MRVPPKSVSSLDHPNILQVYDYAEVEGSGYIVSKYVGGGTLAERVNGRLRLSEVLQYASPLAEALDFAHQRGIVHRDVKPTNVLLELDGSPILADFGIAKMIGESVDPTLTKWMVGTPDYMSPEQVLGSTLDHRSDLYSFAILIYRLLVGELPLRAQNEAATLLAQVYGTVVPPTAVDPELGEDVNVVLLRALLKDPNERYQTAGELVQALAATSK